MAAAWPLPFPGLASATVAADHVVGPERTIPRAALLGVGISSLLPVPGTIVMPGVVYGSSWSHPRRRSRTSRVSSGAGLRWVGASRRQDVYRLSAALPYFNG